MTAAAPAAGDLAPAVPIASPAVMDVQGTPLASVAGLPLVAINAHQQLPLQLTPINFPFWRAQVEALFIGYDLLGYLDGSFVPPPRGHDVAPSPAYVHWLRQDSLILFAIFGSVSAEVIPLIATAPTAAAAWFSLFRLYANSSQSRVMQIKDDHSLITLGNSSVSAFLQPIKAKADELAIIDHPLSDDDITLYVLNSLRAAYRDIASPIWAHGSPYRFEELHSLLVAVFDCIYYIRQRETELTNIF